MKIAFKLLLWVLVTGVILFPALLLILFVIGLSVVVSGAMAISAVGLVLGIIFVALVGLSIMIPCLLLVIRFMTFRTVNVRFQHHGERVVLPVTVKLTGRTIYHAIYENFRAGRRRGRHLYQPGGLGLRLTSTKTCRRILLIRFLLSTALKWRSPLWLMSGIPTQLRINKTNLKYHPQECCASALFLGYFLKLTRLFITPRPPLNHPI